MHRGSQTYRRSYHSTPDKYNSEYEIELFKYVWDRGLGSPVEVRFDTLKEVAGCRMDADQGGSVHGKYPGRGASPGTPEGSAMTTSSHKLLFAPNLVQLQICLRSLV